MRQNPLPAGLLLLSLLSAAGCSALRQPDPPPLPEQNSRIIYPVILGLDCARAPLPPAVDADDNTWAAWKARDRDAGQDCREKLDAVKAQVSAWQRTDHAPP